MKVLSSLIVVTITWALLSWLTIYKATLKAGLAVNQLSNDPIVYTTSRWFEGDFISVFIVVCAGLILFTIWKKKKGNTNQ